GARAFGLADQRDERLRLDLSRVRQPLQARRVRGRARGAHEHLDALSFHPSTPYRAVVGIRSRASFPAALRSREARTPGQIFRPAGRRPAVRREDPREWRLPAYARSSRVARTARSAPTPRREKAGLSRSAWAGDRALA